MNQTISLTTTKGRFQGFAAECGAWLAEMQPSSIRAERGAVSAEVEVDGTPGARVYERAIEAALAAAARIRISLDAQADMHAIDQADEADDFAAAWLGAVRGLAEALGLDDCEGFRAPAGSPAEADGCTVTRIAGDDSTVEAVLWQAAHDLCSRDAEAAPGDRWQWSEPSAQTVERLRRRLRLAAE